MLRKELLLFSILALFCMFSPQFFYLLPSAWARLVLIIAFFAPAVWTITLYLRNHRREAVIAGTLTLFVVPFFVFLVRNINRLQPFFEGVELSETRIIVERYAATGAMDFSLSHSPYLQTHFLIYLLVTLAGMPMAYSNFAIILFQAVFEASVGVFVMKVISKRMNDPRSCLPFVVAFSLIGSRNLMLTWVPYRFLGAWILPLLVFFHFNENKTNARSHIVLLLLTAGLTLGDPLSSLVATLIFSVYSMIRKDVVYAAYAIIPFSYLLYTGSTYLSFLKEYVAYSWDGLVVFLQGLQTGRFPARTLPWERTPSMTNEDSYIVSAAYVTLVMLALAVFLLQARRLVKRGKFATEDRHDNLGWSICICLFISLMIAVAVYIGASVKPEVSFSDIRTIAMIFVSVSLLLSFGSKVLLLQIQASKVLKIMMIVLLGISALGTVYQTYPKSLNDTILTLEDHRIDLRQVCYAGMFFASYYDKGNLLRDYKTGYADLRFVVDAPYAIEIFSETKMEKQLQNQLHSDFLVFDFGGLQHTSSYASRSTYIKAYEAGLNQNLVYDSGGVVVFWKPKS